MNKTIKLLALLLVAQIVLVTGLNLGSGGKAGADAEPLLPADAANADSVTISDSQGKTTSLKKQGNQWIMPDYGNLPVSKEKFDEAFKKLIDAKAPWPVATSASAAKRFEVAENNAQKTVSLAKGDKEIATLYIGTSPSYRKLHVRRAGDNDIYIIDLAQHELPAASEDWMNKSVLQYEGDILSIKTDNFEISRQSADASAQWTLSPAAEATLDSSTINQWAKRFNSLVVKSLLHWEKTQPILMQNPKFTAHIKGSSGDVSLAFYAHEGNYFVKSFDDDKVYEIAKFQAEPLVNATPQDFVAKPDAAEAQADAEPASLFDTGLN